MTSRSSRPVISVIGLGYVGLSTAVCLASKGYIVYGVDLDAKRVEDVQRGRAPFYEKGLKPMLLSVLKNKELRCTTDCEQAIDRTQLTFVAVGTPSMPNGAIDLKYVKSVASTIGTALKEKSERHNITVKSSVVPGTTDGVLKPIIEESSGKKCGDGFDLCVNPEFLREGSAIQDTFHPDAIIIGCSNLGASKILMKIFRRFYDDLPPTIITTAANAEFIKYSVNTFRAVQLTFLNTLANICEKTPGADIEEVARGLSTITKMDNRYLKAGLGYGGSCLPKDIRALIAQAEVLQCNSQLLKATVQVNEKQPFQALEAAKQLIGCLKDKNIAILGLAFKPGTDDTRESVAIKMIESLLEHGAQVTACDPQASENAKKIFGKRIKYVRSARECIKGADCCMIATPWDVFRHIQPKEFVKLMRNPAIVDSWRVYNHQSLKANHIPHATLGREWIVTL